MMKIMSKRDKIVGIKSMLSSPFVSSHLPNTELAAASTEHREFRVVVMPAYTQQDNKVSVTQGTVLHPVSQLKTINTMIAKGLPPLNTLAIEIVCCSIAS